MNKAIPVMLAALATLGAEEPVVAKELRARFMNECPTSEYPKPDSQREGLLSTLADGVAGAFLGKAVDFGIAALKKTLVPEARSISGETLIDGLYERKVKGQEVETVPNEELNCLVVAVGEFGLSPAGWTMPFTAPKERPLAYQRLKDGLGLKAPPSHYLEAVRKYSPDTSAVTWQPVRVYVGEHLDTGFFAGKARGLLVEVKMYAPGASDPFAAQNFSFESVSATPDKPYSRDDGDLATQTFGRWLSLPEPSEAGSKVKPKRERVAIDPLTLSVRLVESPQPYKIAQMFAESVEENAADIKTAVTTQLIPSRRRAAEVEAKSATISAVQAYLTDHAAAVTACTNMDTDAKKLTCSLAREKANGARTTANLACERSRIDACSLMPPLP